MLDNEITLSVDVENNGTTVDTEFSRYEEYQNRTTYIGPNHSPNALDTITFYRTFPKTSANFRGVAKTSVKRSKTIIVPGVDGVSQLSSPMIVESSFSIPVGATLSQILLLRQEQIALLDIDTIMNALNYQLMI